MPTVDKVDVRVCVNGHPLTEYDDPDGCQTHGNEHIKYIEAVAGQNFSIHISWLAGFQLQWAPNLYASYHIDSDTKRHFSTLDAQTLDHRKGRLSNNEIFEVASRTAKAQDGRWKSFNLAFGALGIC